MAQQEKAPERERRDWIIILIILLIGFLCVILAGGWAIRFAPTWKLDTNMGSKIDPNSVFLTSRPSGFIEPLDPSILTQPAWINLFLTPGASVPTSAPVTSLPTNTSVATITAISTIIPPTNTPAGPSPTNTSIYFPPPTNTPKPPPPVIPVDFSITKTDGSTTYAPGSTIIYTVVVTNNSAVNVNGVTVSDTKPSQVTTWGWCVAPCTPTANTNANLSTTANLAAGNSITYSIVANIDPGATGDLVNTASVSVPSGYIDTNNGNSSATDTDTQAIPSTDLQILKTDGATTYTPGNQVIYGIVVFNAGPNEVTGAIVTDIFPAQITSVSWDCTPLLGASCSTPNGSGNIVNHSINLPVGSSVAYVATADIHASAIGNLVNTASVSVPAGYTDTNPGNNSDTDTDTPAVGSDIDIGLPDGNAYNPGQNGSITILFSPAVTADGTSNPDFVYYEVENSPGSGIVDMDWVMIEISTDGISWLPVPVFVWGDGIPDTNSNLDINVILGVEGDNRQITSPPLYNQTGVTIDIDAIPGVVTGTLYPWMRISGIGGVDGPNIDAIQPYYP